MNCFGATYLLLICTVSMFTSIYSAQSKKNATITETTATTAEVWLRVQKDFNSFVSKKFEEFHIVPDLIVEAPDELCNVTYPSGAVVKIGEKLSKDQIKEEPVLEWKCDEDELYAMFMQNMDDRDWDHTDNWAVLNIRYCNLYEGDDIYDYKEQCPDIRQDQYRIVFLIYKQPNFIDYYKNYYGDNVNAFIEIQHYVDMHEMGKPVAGNFFVVDDLELRKKVQNT